MGIFDRMSKVISSNVNTLLDKAEDPKKSVDLMIEQMHDQLRKGRQDVVSAVAAEKQLRTKIQELDDEVAKWQRRAELAMKASDEPLAREALLQKNRVVSERDRAEALRAQQRGIALRMKDDLERADAKLKELEARKGTIVAQYMQARAGGGAQGLGANAPAGSTAFDDFQRMEEKIERADLETEAMREVQDALDPGKARGGMSRDEVEAQFEKLESGTGAASNADAAIDDELNRLRTKVRIGQ